MMQVADLVAWGFPYSLSHQDSELSKPMRIRNSLLFHATSAGQFRNGRGPSPKSRGEKGILTRAFPGCSFPMSVFGHRVGSRDLMACFSVRARRFSACHPYLAWL